MSDLEALRKALHLNLPEKYVPWTPSAHQAAFLLVPAKEAFYGGAAGGGKSIALLMAALQYVEHPGYNALLVRKTFKDLAQPEALIDISKEWLTNTDAKWNSSDHQWTFPSGAVLKFGHLENENDKYNYQGAAYHFIGFDELTQFPEGSFTYLQSRCRRRKGDDAIGANIPLRIRAAANPGGIGHEWVKRRFIELPDDEELEEGEAEKFAKRVFIPSGLSDNPHLDQAEYREMLEGLDLVTRRQLMNGDWDIAGDGNMFKREWFDGRIISQLPYDLQFRRLVRYWDLASTDEAKVVKEKGDPDYTASVLQGLGSDGNLYVLEVTRDRMSPASVERMVKIKAERDRAYGDSHGVSVATYMEQEPGSSGESTIFAYKKVLMGYNFRGDKPSGNKIERARPASATCEHGFVYILKGAKTKAFLNEMEAFPMGAHDDMVDAFTGGMAQLVKSANIGQAKNRKISRRKRRIWDS